jgi:hypothetical protein
MKGWGTPSYSVLLSPSYFTTFFISCGRFPFILVASDMKANRTHTIQGATANHQEVCCIHTSVAKEKPPEWLSLTKAAGTRRNACLTTFMVPRFRITSRTSRSQSSSTSAPRKSTFWISMEPVKRHRPTPMRNRSHFTSLKRYVRDRDVSGTFYEGNPWSK